MIAPCLPLHEECRPQTFADVIGQDKALAKIDALRRRGLSGRAYWITGNSGTGKTTIAYLVARETADEMSVCEIDASELTPARLRELEQTAQTYGMGSKHGRAFIVNEAHGLRRDSIRQLLVMLERIPSHVTWIFTTTREGNDSLFEDYDDASPLTSRCVSLPLTSRGLADAFAQRAFDIATAHGLAAQPLSAFLRCVKDNRNNMRAVLTAVESGDFL